jgi:quercetin dioxygenase-like cupin family protein
MAVAVSAGFSAGQFSAAREPVSSLVPLLASGTTIVGEPIAYPSSAPAKITVAILTLAPGQETGWHTHGIPAFGYILEGELMVDYGAKGERIYKAGDALLEAIVEPHNGRNTGAGPMRILAVFIGAEGLPTSVPAVKRD